MRSILALDISVEGCGWAAGAPDGDPRFGTVRLPNRGQDMGATGCAFEKWLDAMMVVEKPVVVAFEAPLLIGPRTHFQTARKLMGLAFLCETIATRHDARCYEENNATLKKWFAGHGRAEKPDMIAVAKRYGWDVQDHNAADACALWAFTVKNFAPKHAGRFEGGPMLARPLVRLGA